MYLYQRTSRYFAQTADDIKELAEEELQTLGAEETRLVYRGIHFKASAQDLYRINFHTRLVNRVLAPLVSFKCHSDRYLYNKALELRWQDFLNTSQTFAVDATVNHSIVKHSKFAALRLKDAVVDYFRERDGKRPSVDTRDPTVRINLHIDNNEATISLDTSGGSLHRRGYRQKSVEAPMGETLAAAIIRSTGWQADSPLHDPFCGSGTLLCEAYMHACRIPAGNLRNRFGFENLPDFDRAPWEQVRAQGRKAIAPIEEGMIAGSDLSNQAVDSARHNCSLIDEHNAVKLRQCDVFDIDSLAGKTIICNPPYGIRLHKHANLSDFYKKFGDFLKQRCQGATAYIYFGERKYIKNIGLRSSWKKPLSNGGLDGRLVKYELY